eukprot:NODE_123_length_17687_cov_0.732261.p4 type:complete len:498 gc:universal NODE_123_length_17687_cov_0.732261:12701-14194(+)
MQWVMFFLCSIFGKFGSQYISPWADSINLSPISPFEQQYIAPPYFRSVVKYKGEVYGQCKIEDWGVVDINGIPQCGLDCHESCKSCTYPNITGYCSICQVGYKLFPNLKEPRRDIPRALNVYCGLDVPCAIDNGQYQDWLSGKCVDCHSSCKTCWGTGSNDCLSCYSGRFPTYNRSCQICDSSCLTCSSSNVCESCRNGFQLTNGQCIANSATTIYTITIQPIFSTKTIKETSISIATSTSTLFHYNISKENNLHHFSYFNSSMVVNQITTKIVEQPQCLRIATSNISSQYSTDMFMTKHNNTVTYDFFTSLSVFETNYTNLTLSPLTLRKNCSNYFKTCEKPTIAIVTSFVTNYVTSQCRSSTLNHDLQSSFQSHEDLQFQSSTMQTRNSPTLSQKITSEFKDILATETSEQRLSTSTVTVANRATINDSSGFDVSSMVVLASNPMFLILIILICLLFIIFAMLIHIQKQKIGVLMEQMHNIDMNVSITEPVKMLH